MDKKELYKKAEETINHAFDMAKKSAKLFSEKAGETAHITKLLLEKMSLEHRVTKQFAKLGSRIYEKSIREGKAVSSADKEIKSLIDEARKIDIQLAEVEASIDKEKKKTPGRKKAAAK